MTRAPTIYEALRAKLGREPTHREQCDDVRRILEDGQREMAERGQLRHQRKRKRKSRGQMAYEAARKVRPLNVEGNKAPTWQQLDPRGKWLWEMKS